MIDRYSIWVLPEKLTEQELLKIIVFLSQLYGEPNFKPHMTLLGNVKAELNQMINIIDKLAEELSQFNLELGEISFSTTFFQSVFVRILATTQLIEQNLKAKRLLQLENNLSMPHVSLMYDNHFMEILEEVVRRVLSPNTGYNVNRLALVPSTSNTLGGVRYYLPGKNRLKVALYKYQIRTLKWYNNGSINES